MLAIAFALNREFEAVGICLMGAFLADLYDGPVAKRLTGRTEFDKQFGLNLDSFIDLIGAGVVPATVLLSLGDFEGWYLPGAFLLVGAAVMRLSYFNVHGLSSESHYTGLPTDQVILLFTALMLTDEVLSLGGFRVVLYAGAVLLALLMVSPLRLRKLEGAWYVILPVVAVGLSLAHAARLAA